jgi:hypothetical protein
MACYLAKSSFPITCIVTRVPPRPEAFTLPRVLSDYMRKELTPVLVSELSCILVDSSSGDLEPFTG